MGGEEEVGALLPERPLSIILSLQNKILHNGDTVSLLNTVKGKDKDQLVYVYSERTEGRRVSVLRSKYDFVAKVS